MALGIYCAICGFRSEYKTTKPSFCGGCGAKFGVAIASSPKITPSIRKPEVGIDRDEESFELPQINKIAVDFVPDRPARVKLLEVWGANNPDNKENVVPDER